MSLNFGRSQLAIPGPSVMPEKVLAAMHRPSPNIYGAELIKMTEGLYPDLKRVGRTDHHVAIYIANGHGVWEASLRNVLSKGDKVLAIVTGLFGMGWAQTAKELGLDVEILDFGTDSDADPQKVEEVLRKDADGEIKAVITVQTDTATSVRNDIAAMRQAISAAGHDCLFMVDCIASLGCERFEMDEWGVDVMVAACQKGLMTPAGIAFVYFNEKALQVSGNVDAGPYWDWKPRVEPEIFYQRFAGTAPTQHLYALRAALDILLVEEGIENAWARHETIASSVWSAIEHWGSEGTMEHNIVDKSKRSLAVSAIRTPENYAGLIREWSEAEAGVGLGIGLGLSRPGTPQWDQFFRIGHMGHQNIAMTMAVLGSIDTAMKANNIPHGSGALDASARILANHGRM